VACNHASPTEAQVNGRVTHTITADAGSDFDIVLQTIGPGHYTESPSISSGGVQFQSVAYVGPFVPAGPTQQYRFHAASAGTVVITFQHTEDNPTVQDAVIVK
jgi:hypothetical protein